MIVLKQNTIRILGLIFIISILLSFAEKPERIFPLLNNGPCKTVILSKEGNFLILSTIRGMKLFGSLPPNVINKLLTTSGCKLLEIFSLNKLDLKHIYFGPDNNIEFFDNKVEYINYYAEHHPEIRKLFDKLPLSIIENPESISS